MKSEASTDVTAARPLSTPIRTTAQSRDKAISAPAWSQERRGSQVLRNAAWVVRAAKIIAAADAQGKPSSGRRKSARKF